MLYIFVRILVWFIVIVVGFVMILFVVHMITRAIVTGYFSVRNMYDKKKTRKGGFQDVKNRHNQGRDRKE